MRRRRGESKEKPPNPRDVVHVYDEGGSFEQTTIYAKCRFELGECDAEGWTQHHFARFVYDFHDGVGRTEWVALPARAQCGACRATMPPGVWQCFADSEVVTSVEASLILVTKEFYEMAQLPKDAVELFDNLIPAGLERYPDRAKALGAIYYFKVEGGPGGGDWTVDLTVPSCTRGDSGKAQCTVTIDAADFKTILSDPNAGMQLYFQGKLRVGGDPMLAMKLAQLFELARPA